MGFSKKQWNALIGLIVYLFLGLFTPETMAAITISVDGPHALSIQADAHGNESLVLHHHGLKASKAAENRFHHYHPEKPDHRILLSKSDSKAFLSSENKLPISLKPIVSVLIGFLLMSNPLTGQKTALPHLYAHPPPPSQTLLFRQTIALLI
jgi:hypothetical protein